METNPLSNSHGVNCMDLNHNIDSVEDMLTSMEELKIIQREPMNHHTIKTGTSLTK